MQRHPLATVRRTAFAGAIALLLATPVALAQEKPGRYVMSPAEGGGFMRMDTETGAMSLCQRRAEQWVCAPVNDAGQAERDEAARLRGENAELRATKKHLEEMLGVAGDRAQAQRPAEKPTFRVPSEKDTLIRR